MHSDTEVSAGARKRLEADDERQRFNDDARSAEIVEKADGVEALLIAGQVIEVFPSRYADLISRALRSGGRDGSAQSVAASGALIGQKSQDSSQGPGDPNFEAIYAEARTELESWFDGEHPSIDHFLRETVGMFRGEVVRACEVEGGRAYDLSFGGEGIATVSITRAEWVSTNKAFGLLKQKVDQAKRTCLEGNGG